MRVRGRPIITLTTDFGLEDTYVGVVKGVILAINGDAAIVDLCHAVPAQNTAEAAFLIADASRFFPPDTVHLVVVDPGVGSSRASIAMRTHTGNFVAPDNGVLSDVIRAQSPDLSPDGGTISTALLGNTVQVVHLAEQAYWLPRVSGTFHARDIFAPVAAHLSAGVPIDRLGPPAQTVEILPFRAPVRRRDGTLLARVVHVDHFGNLITDLTADQARALGPAPTFRIKGHVTRGLFRFYEEGTGLTALIGSGDRVEIALRQGSAALALGARVGDQVEVIPDQL